MHNDPRLAALESMMAGAPGPESMPMAPEGEMPGAMDSGDPMAHLDALEASGGNLDPANQEKLFQGLELLRQAFGSQTPSEDAMPEGMGDPNDEVV